MRVIGIDPGSRITGYGVLELSGSSYELLDSGVIKPRETSIEDRITEIHRALSELLELHRPQAVAVEDVFYEKNVRSTIKLAYAPSEWRKAKLQPRNPRVSVVGNVLIYGPNTRKGLALVEDAAQAHGARGPDGRRAGAYGRMGCFSFHPSKNLGAFGDGGMITTSDGEAAERLRVMRNLGKVTKYDIGYAAPNTKLDTLQAALLGIKLPRLDGWNARRRRFAEVYRKELSGVGDLVLPHDPGGEAHVYHLFVVRTRARDALRRHLKEHGVNAGLHYPVPPHLQKLDVDFGYAEGSLPVTEELARTVLSLPVAPELEEEQVRYVCDEIRRFFGA